MRQQQREASGARHAVQASQGKSQAADKAFVFAPWARRARLPVIVACASLALALIAPAPAPAQGFFGGLLGGGGKEEQQQAPPAAAPGAAQSPTAGQRPTGGIRTAQPGEDPTVGTRPQATPTAAQRKAEVKKLTQAVAPERIPSDLFSRYVGKWTGRLWTYDYKGRLEGRAAIQAQCEMRGGDLLMKVSSFDQLGRQLLMAEEYTYHKTDAGTVKVTINRPTRQTSTQTGTFNDGALFLVADINDGVEFYRERVDGKIWRMHGTAAYDKPKPNGQRDAHHFVMELLKDTGQGQAAQPATR